MRITVRLFAGLRERAGTDEIRLTELPAALDVAGLKRELEQRRPELGPLGYVRGVVGTEYVPDRTALSDGDEVALLPPVSGGSAVADHASAEVVQGEGGAKKKASIARAGSKPGRGPHLQAGVFLQPDNAQALKATLEAQGVPVYIESRVHIGPFRDRKEAERMREKLKELGHSTVLVTQ